MYHVGMTVELEAIQAFLGQCDPFATLSDPLLVQLAAAITITYVRRGETIIGVGAANDYCYVIRSGAVDIFDEDGALLDRREATRSFGYSTILGENSFQYQVLAVEDCLLYCIERQDFLPVARDHPHFRAFFSSQSKRMSQAAEQTRSSVTNEVLRTPLREAMTAHPVTCSPTTSIQQAAALMAAKNISCLLLTDETGTLCGIVTDRDLRRKVVATALDVDLPISEIMTANPISADAETLAFEAMLIMAEQRIHHLPITTDGVLSGIVSTADIMRLLRNDPIYVIADLHQQPDATAMAESIKHAGEVALRFIDRGASPEEVTNLITVTYDAAARRLIALAHEKYGPAPVPYSFVVLGSQGRRGMGLASDQDNALILSDDFDPAQHGQWFADFAHFICTGLATAGQPLCPGDMMASNPNWRMTVTKWQETFHTWITAPEPDALLYAQVFFDMRSIAGEAELAQAVLHTATSLAQDAARMHAHLAALAARREPPLGFFRGFVVDRAGEYANTLDVKKGGTAAIVQMARLFALAGGVPAIATRQRLLAAAAAGAVSQQGAQGLVDAFDFLNKISLQHQAEQLRAGKQPDYHLDPGTLSKRDREYLRDAFSIIKNMQNALASKYPVRSI